MKKKLYTTALMGAMVAAGSSMDCKNEVIYPDTYSLNFDATTIPCGDVNNFTPYEKKHYCEGKDDNQIVTLEPLYDISEDTRTKITAVVACVLDPLSQVIVEMQSDKQDAVSVHIGGFARITAGGTSTYDEGNRNYTKDRVYVADRFEYPASQNIIYFSPEMVSFMTLHEIGHTLGLKHGSADSIMTAKIDHSVEYPFHFTRDEAKLLLENTHDQISEENIKGLTKADERCVEELSALKSLGNN